MDYDMNDYKRQELIRQRMAEKEEGILFIAMEDARAKFPDLASIDIHYHGSGDDGCIEDIKVNFKGDIMGMKNMSIYTERNYVLIEGTHNGEKVDLGYWGDHLTGKSEASSTNDKRYTDLSQADKDELLSWIDKRKQLLEASTGQIPENTYNKEAPMVQNTLERKLEDYVYNQLSRECPGWEINDGSEGNLIWKAEEPHKWMHEYRIFEMSSSDSDNCYVMNTDKKKWEE